MGPRLNLDFLRTLQDDVGTRSVPCDMSGVGWLAEEYGDHYGHDTADSDHGGDHTESDPVLRRVVRRPDLRSEVEASVSHEMARNDPLCVPLTRIRSPGYRDRSLSTRKVKSAR